MSIAVATRENVKVITVSSRATNNCAEKFFTHSLFSFLAGVSPIKYRAAEASGFLLCLRKTFSLVFEINKALILNASLRKGINNKNRPPAKVKKQG
jgi:hypothetical protein